MTSTEQDLIIATSVSCPCCHGTGELWQCDANYPDDPPQRYRCTHCQGTGALDSSWRKS